MKTHLNDLKWTISNLIHLLLGDEKRMSNADWFYYIEEKIDSLTNKLYENGNINDDFIIDSNFSYVTDGLSSLLNLKKFSSNKFYNNELKRVGDIYANTLVLQKYNEYKG